MTSNPNSIPEIYPSLVPLLCASQRYLQLSIFTSPFYNSFLQAHFKIVWQGDLNLFDDSNK